MATKKVSGEMSTKPKVYKFPKSMAVCADTYYQLREKRYAAKKILDELEKEEKAYRQHLIDNIPKSEASGVAGKVCRVTVLMKEEPRLEDKEVFYKYIKKTGRFDLLQSRLSSASIQEIWEDGKEIPGVSHFRYPTLSVNKL